MKKEELNSTVAGNIHYLNLTNCVKNLAAEKMLPDELIKLIGIFIDSHAWEFEMETVQLFRELLHL